eukprot:4949702-Prymnesium_polylepis.1
MRSRVAHPKAFAHFAVLWVDEHRAQLGSRRSTKPAVVWVVEVRDRRAHATAIRITLAVHLMPPAKGQVKHIAGVERHAHGRHRRRPVDAQVVDDCLVRHSATLSRKEPRMI